MPINQKFHWTVLWSRTILMISQLQTLTANSKVQSIWNNHHIRCFSETRFRSSLLNSYKLKSWTSVCKILIFVLVQKIGAEYTKFVIFINVRADNSKTICKNQFSFKYKTLNQSSMQTYWSLIKSYTLCIINCSHACSFKKCSVLLIVWCVFV